jgi:hypothetical protein
MAMLLRVAGTILSKVNGSEAVGSSFITKKMYENFVTGIFSPRSVIRLFDTVTRSSKMPFRFWDTLTRFPKSLLSPGPAVPLLPKLTICPINMAPDFATATSVVSMLPVNFGVSSARTIPVNHKEARTANRIARVTMFQINSPIISSKRQK